MSAAYAGHAVPGRRTNLSSSGGWPARLSVRSGAPAPPGGRNRLGGDLQEQVAEAAGAGAALRRTALALGLGAGSGAPVDVVGQRDQPDKKQIFAAGIRFGRSRHDITPCRRFVGAVGSTGMQGRWSDRAFRLGHPPRCRPPRPSGFSCPRLVSGLRSVPWGPAWRLPGANRPVALCHAPSPIPLRGQRRSCTDFPILPACEGGAPGTSPFYAAAGEAPMQIRHAAVSAGTVMATARTLWDKTAP